MFLNLNKKRILINLLNGRITYKTFTKWKFFSSFSKNLFEKFTICLSSSNESQKYLKKLGAKNVKFFGNLKFSESEKKIDVINDNLKKYFNSKKYGVHQALIKLRKYFVARYIKN